MNGRSLSARKVIGALSGSNPQNVHNFQNKRLMKWVFGQFVNGDVPQAGIGRPPYLQPGRRPTDLPRP